MRRASSEGLSGDYWATEGRIGRLGTRIPRRPHLPAAVPPPSCLDLFHCCPVKTSGWRRPLVISTGAGPKGRRSGEICPLRCRTAPRERFLRSALRAPVEMTRRRGPCADGRGRCRAGASLLRHVSPSRSSCPDLFRASTSLRRLALSRPAPRCRETWMPGTSPGMTAGDGGGGDGGAAKVVSPVARYVGNPPLRGPFARSAGIEPDSSGTSPGMTREAAGPGRPHS